MSTSLQRANHLNRFDRLRRSFREQTHNFRSALRNERSTSTKRASRNSRPVSSLELPPGWMLLFAQAYHNYGLKHVLLLTVLLVYQFIGAGVFYLCEASNDEMQEIAWKYGLSANRARLVATLVNTTSITEQEQLKHILTQKLMDYEKQLKIRHSDQKLRWDFWNAMLYAQSICTTIGYGHLYAVTGTGKLFTMIYAVFGIPLVLTVLDDLGKLLTSFLKSPWYLLKCRWRRLFRYCKKQPMKEILRLEAEDKKELERMDLPVSIAIFVVICWILLCSTTFCLWEKDWDYFIAFYFFFISLSTIGLGDVTPTQPKYLLMLFVYIIVGLSLVSMCVNLIQRKYAQTYEEEVCSRPMQTLENIRIISFNSGLDQAIGFIKTPVIKKQRGSSLGVLRSESAASGGVERESLSREALQTYLQNKTKHNRSTQTMLAFPSSTRNSTVVRMVTQNGFKYLPQSLSIDDVMQLVDTEDGDMILLSDIMKREESSGILSSETDCASETSELFTTSTSGDSQPIVPSKSFDNGFPARQLLTHTALTFPTTVLASILAGTSKSTYISRLPTLTDLELIEELEDRMLLTRSCSFETNPSVHFRSRLSLIPEQLERSVEEEDEQSPMDENGNSREMSSSSRSSLTGIFGNFFSSTLAAGVARETRLRTTQQP